MDTLKVVVNQRKSKGETVWTGSFDFPGLVGKVARKSDNSTSFSTKNALLSSARGLATRLGRTLEVVEPTRKAAKASVRKSKAPTTETNT